MSDTREVGPSPSTDSSKEVHPKEDQAVVEPLRRFEIELATPKQATIQPVPSQPAVVHGPMVRESSTGLTDRQMVLLLVALLVVAALGICAIVAIHAMRT